jgi:[protein-PII] uridylyltransferase
LGVRGFDACRAHAAAVDAWLSEVVGTLEIPQGVALVALGGYGRSTLSPHSDLDLLLVGRKTPSESLGSAIWYPIWDTGVKLGHSVRSMRDTISLARHDLDTMTAILDTRIILGDERIADDLREQAKTEWRKRAGTWLERLAESIRERMARADDIRFAVEPDLKTGKGGLRDLQCLRWAQLTSEHVPIRSEELVEQHDTLLTIRNALHLSTKRPTDRITVDLREEVARRAGYPSGDDLLAAVSAAARPVAWAVDELFHDIDGRRRRRDDPRLDDPEAVIVGQRVALRTHVEATAETAVRAAIAAARTDRRLEVATLERVADVEVPSHWSDQLRSDVTELLGCGRRSVDVIEALDHTGLWTRLFPEWEPARSRPQHNPYHAFTVDRHLLETVAIAATLEAPSLDPRHRELLLWSALLHDLGKAYPGDHSAVGAELVERIMTRVGFDDDDVETVSLMVGQHLLLADTATRRDLDDPSTLTLVASRLGRIDRLELLQQLSIADGRATGPTAWSEWKSDLVADLVERVRHVLKGAAPIELVSDAVFSDELAELATSDPGATVVRGHGDVLQVVTPDQPGLFSRITGAVSLHGLHIRDAHVGTVDDMAIEELVVESDLGIDIPWDRVVDDVRRAIRGSLALRARMANRAASYPAKAVPHTFVPAVRMLPSGNEGVAIVEVVGPDSIGLLYRLTCTLSEMGLDITRSMVSTVGNDVVDVFYVEANGGLDLTEKTDQDELRLALLHALADTPS